MENFQRLSETQLQVSSQSYTGINTCQGSLVFMIKYRFFPSMSGINLTEDSPFNQSHKMFFTDFSLE